METTELIIYQQKIKNLESKINALEARIVSEQGFGKMYRDAHDTLLLELNKTLEANAFLREENKKWEHMKFDR